MQIVISQRLTTIFLLSAGAFFISFLKPFGLSPDYSQYELFFGDLNADFAGTAISSRFEPGFVFISGVLIKFLGSDAAAYSVFVLLSIWVKLRWGLKDALGVYFWIAVVFYFFKYFPLHELNQLRAALGAAAAVLAFSIKEDGKTKLAFYVCCAGVLFHYSVLIILPFLFLPRFDRRGVLLISLVVYAVCALFVTGLQQFAAKYFSVLELYETASGSEKEFNKFSPVFFPEFMLIGFSLWWWRHLTPLMQRVVYLQLIGFALLYAFSSIGVVAVRTHEFFSVLWIFYVAHAQFVKRRIRNLIFVFVLLSVAISVYLFFSGSFFDSGYA